jgi:hypothetical protein
MVRVEVIEGDDRKQKTLSLLEDVDLDMQHWPSHIRSGDVRISGMIYLFDEDGQAEGFAELSIQRRGDDCICLELTREGDPIVRWEHPLSGTPLFRAMVASVLCLPGAGLVGSSLPALPLRDPVATYVLAAARRLPPSPPGAH